LDSNKHNILIAPSWGKFSIFKNTNLLVELVQNIGPDYEIYLRPHPMEDLTIDTKNNLNHVIFDFEKDLKNLGYFDFVITDWSGIGIEYSVIKKRKTLYINTIKKRDENCHCMKKIWN